MRTIRRGVFETNSSSTHSISIVSAEEYDKWKNGKLLFDEDADEFVENDKTKDIEKVCSECNYKTKDNFEYCPKCGEEFKYNNGDLKTYEEYMFNGELETYSSSFTTKSGDAIVAFGQYGHD